MSFGSDPERDDGSPPPANMVIPDDARELERDVIAYRRELRARRRRARLARLLRPLRGHAAILPLIAACVALSMMVGTMFSLMTISPASAPTLSATPPASPSGSATSRPVPPAGLTTLPEGTFSVGDTPQPIPTLKTAALALVPANCGCDQVLSALARSAQSANAGVYFVGEGRGIAQIPDVTTRDGAGVATAASDISGVFARAYRPSGLTVLLVYSDGTTRVIRGAAAASRLRLPALRALARPGH